MNRGSLFIYFLTTTFKRKVVYVLFVAILIATFCLPKISSWAYYEINTASFFNKIQQIVSFSTKPRPEIDKVYVTAYSSNEDETDDSPCIAASGYNLCTHNKENVVAANFLPIGTKVVFPDLDPNKIYTVVDRMHERFNSRVDIWMTSKIKAKKFGIKLLTVEIYKE